MPVVTIKIDETMFKTLKDKFPYHGDISRIIRNAIRAINKGIEFSPEGNLVRINEVPSIFISITTHLSLMEQVKDDEELKKIAIKNADTINEAFYVNGFYSKAALQMLFMSLELANIMNYKWHVQEDQSGAVLIYIKKSIYPPRIMKIYFNEYVKYFCKLNRLNVEISGTESLPIYRIKKSDGGVFI